MKSTPEPIAVTVYTRESCHLCDEALETLETVGSDEGIELDIEEIDIDTSERLRDEYGERIPYVLIEGRPSFKYRLEPDEVRKRLNEAVTKDA